MNVLKNDVKGFERKLTAQPVKDSPFGPAGFNVAVEIIGPATPWQGCGLVLDRGEVAAVVAEMVAWLGIATPAPVNADDGALSSEPGGEAPHRPDDAGGRGTDG